MLSISGSPASTGAPAHTIAGGSPGQVSAPRRVVLLVVAAWGGTLERIHHALYVLCREQAGCEASPTAAIIDSQSVEGLAGLVRDLTAIAPDVLRTAA